jgi:hypothetical protein
MIYLDHRFEIDTYDNDFYCGIDPSDSRFFVGRSEVIFNRTTPELLKTEYNIRSLNEERSMEQILLTSLKNLRSILHRQVIKYRVIYIKENLLTRQKKNSRYTTFSPDYNTYYISYDSNFAKKIRGTKLGIIIENEYRGNDLTDMREFPVRSLEQYKNRTNVLFLKYLFRTKSYQCMVDRNDILLLQKLGDSEAEINETINTSNY